MGETFGEMRERLLTDLRRSGLRGRVLAWWYERRFRRQRDRALWGRNPSVWR